MCRTILHRVVTCGSYFRCGYMWLQADPETRFGDETIEQGRSKFRRRDLGMRRSIRDGPSSRDEIWRWDDRSGTVQVPETRFGDETTDQGRSKFRRRDLEMRRSIRDGPSLARSRSRYLYVSCMYIVDVHMYLLSEHVSGPTSSHWSNLLMFAVEVSCPHINVYVHVCLHTYVLIGMCTCKHAPPSVMVHICVWTCWCIRFASISLCACGMWKVVYVYICVFVFNLGLHIYQLVCECMLYRRASGAI